jgi:hypothetical protein
VYEDNDSMDASTRSGSISLSSSISRSSFSFRRMSFSVTGGNSTANSTANRESMSMAGDQGPLGSILLSGATLEHSPGQKDFIVRTSESAYHLRAQSGAEAGDWANAIRANVLASTRSATSRMNPSSSTMGASIAGAGGGGSGNVASAELLGGAFEEVFISYP